MNSIVQDKLEFLCLPYPWMQGTFILEDFKSTLILKDLVEIILNEPEIKQNNVS